MFLTEICIMFNYDKKPYSSCWLITELLKSKNNLEKKFKKKLTYRGWFDNDYNDQVVPILDN